jgi:hypothetical protein
MKTYKELNINEKINYNAIQKHLGFKLNGMNHSMQFICFLYRSDYDITFFINPKNETL